MNRNDLSGDGAADIIVTSPWGLGVLAQSGGAFIGRTLAANGSRLGEWLLNTRNDNIELRADMDGDRAGELLLASPWGIGLLDLTAQGLRSIAMAPNGRRVGGWIVDTSNNQFLHAGDFDGNGRDEVLLTSPWGLGLLNWQGDFGTLMLAPNGTRFGDWLLNTADNAFPLVADLDGDGRPEIVVTSPWGLGVLRFDAGGLRSIAMVPNGTPWTRPGGGEPWRFDSATDRIEVAANFGSTGRAELIVSNERGSAVLRLGAGGFELIGELRSGTVLGNWRYDAGKDRIGPAADFDGNGRAELVVVSGAGFSLLALEQSDWVLRAQVPNGTRMGGWLLNTWDNRLNHAVRFDATDPRAQLMVSSPWGLGLLRLNDRGGGTHVFDALAMAPNGTRLGQWLLNTADNDLEAGLGQSWALLISHPDWNGAIANTHDFLRQRGFTVTATQNIAEGLFALRQLALKARAGDRVFVYLAGHGATRRPLGDHSRTAALGHVLQFGDGSLIDYGRIAPWLHRMGAAGVDLIVFDGSCDGGEAVMAALGERYLALSTTSIHAPGITNTPDPSNLMAQVGRPNSFGLWWSAEPTASLMNAQVPHRFYQKIYRSDDTEINELSLFYKPGISFYLSVAGGWDLMVRRCHLYRYIYPAEYAAFSATDKAAMNVGTEAYLSSMRTDLEAMAPPIARLRDILADGQLMERAAAVYAAAYPAPWQLLFGDRNWNVDTEPIRRSPAGVDIEPRHYAGASGFLAMVADIQRTLAVFAQSYVAQESRLRQLHQAIVSRRLVTHLESAVRPRLRADPASHQAFNAYDLSTRTRQQTALKRALPTQRALLAKVDAVPIRQLDRTDFSASLIQELGAIERTQIHTVRVLGIDELVARILATQTANWILLERLFYLLTIAEEAVSRASAGQAQTGDLLSF